MPTNVSGTTSRWLPSLDGKYIETKNVMISNADDSDMNKARLPYLSIINPRNGLEIAEIR
jgi:hypothetical protein